MRVGAVLLRKRYAREPQTAPFKFVELLPLQLKNKVSGKSDPSSQALCIQEMAVLFACLKTNEFNDGMCSSELQAFEKCFKTQTKLKLEQGEQELLGKDNPGAKKLTHRQLNRLLAKHPQFNEPAFKPYMPST